MLELNDIKKDYVSGSTTVSALKGINLRFRDCEFVSILGQSGCGKTTMLNIIGGLDKYTSGDLKINGVSTKNYKDRDWDFYRNNSIGFVFQSYNLIPHQTVLSNVELALTLSGVSKAERKKRAIEALEKVGLGEQIHKKPNQMSGGQMQRVAIARALVNNPDILMPTDSRDRVKVYYTGTNYKGQVFDSSYFENKPEEMKEYLKQIDPEGYDKDEAVEFELGQVIPGWTEGLKLIGKGGKITLWIPAELAYGRQARGKYILPNSALKFEVELEDVIPFVEETTPATTDEAAAATTQAANSALPVKK